MAFKHDKNTGSFFVNDYNKEKKHPDFTGTCDIDGKQMDVAVWHNKAKENKKENYFFKITEPMKKEQSASNSTAAPQFDGDIPF